MYDKMRPSGLGSTATIAAFLVAGCQPSDDLETQPFSPIAVETMIDHKRFHNGTYETHYYVAGRDDAPPVLFLHAAFADHRMFDQQIDAFAARHRIVAVDMLGHGLSQAPDMEFSLAGVLRDIRQILAAEKLGPVHLVGVSMGSLVAQMYAMEYPRDAATLTVTGGFDITRANEEVTSAQGKQAFFLSLLPLTFIKKQIAATTVVNPTAQRRFYEASRAVTRATLKSTLRESAKLAEGVRRTRAALPTLLVLGEHDIELTHRLIRQWHAGAADTELVVVPAAGHCANMDNPEVFNQTVLRFLTGERAPGATE